MSAGTSIMRTSHDLRQCCVCGSAGAFDDGFTCCFSRFCYALGVSGGARAEERRREAKKRNMAARNPRETSGVRARESETELQRQNFRDRTRVRTPESERLFNGVCCIRLARAFINSQNRHQFLITSSRAKQCARHWLLLFFTAAHGFGYHTFAFLYASDKSR